MFAFRLPPLRERKEDLPLLVQSFINEFNTRNQKSIAGVDHQAMRMLEQHAWPGNVRELRNVIERATILAAGPFIEPKHLPPALVDRTGAAASAAGGARARHDGRRSRAAADPDDARAHARQQDARGRDPRHQPEDAAQQAEQAAAAAEEEEASSWVRHEPSHATLGIKGKQVLGVTSIVGAVVVVLSLLHLATLARVGLEESRARAELLANAIFHRAQLVVAEGADPYEALRGDPGLRSILASSLLAKT